MVCLVKLIVNQPVTVLSAYMKPNTSNNLY
jgi:hypothetical protein